MQLDLAASPAVTVFLTASLLKRAMPRCPDPAAWSAELADACLEYGITTRLRVAAFLATVGHESADLTTLTENLNYSATALLQKWPKRVSPELARKIGRVDGVHKADQDAIAEAVYGLRADLGNLMPGDGRAYKGRGPIQLTGFDNYNALAVAYGLHVGEVADWLVTPRGGARSAAWYWNSRRLNPLADAQAFDTICMRVNGAKTIAGANGLEDRRARYARLKALLK